MKTTVYVPDIECDSCVNLLRRRFKTVQGIENISFAQDRVDIEHDTSLVKPEQLIEVVKHSGFRASTSPFSRKTWKERVRHFKEKKDHYALELTGITYGLRVFIMLVILQAIAYFGFLHRIPNFIAHYGWWLFYLTISISAIGTAIWHFYSYRAQYTCMVGMMVGMTIGMQTGMMVGAVVGATNGFFVGSMVGMLLGSLVGWITGQCCGVMGIMEGLMAGIMGGTMGPMISVMMFSDNLLVFMPFYIALNLIILGGFSYMLLEEVGEGQATKEPVEFVTFASLALVVLFIIAAIMIYGPKSPLVSF